LGLAINLVTLPHTNNANAKSMSNWLKMAGLADNPVTRNFVEISSILGRGAPAKKTLSEDI